MHDYDAPVLIVATGERRMLASWREKMRVMVSYTRAGAIRFHVRARALPFEDDHRRERHNSSRGLQQDDDDRGSRCTGEKLDGEVCDDR